LFDNKKVKINDCLDQLFSLPKRKKIAKKKLATLQVDRRVQTLCFLRR